MAADWAFSADGGRCVTDALGKPESFLFWECAAACETATRRNLETDFRFATDWIDAGDCRGASDSECAFM